MEARRRPKASLIVAREILEDINSRGNQVGERLPSEEHLAERYGVGRATMREALRFLELQGVVAQPLIFLPAEGLVEVVRIFGTGAEEVGWRHLLFVTDNDGLARTV